MSGKRSLKIRYALNRQKLSAQGPDDPMRSVGTKRRRKRRPFSSVSMILPQVHLRNGEISAGVGCKEREAPVFPALPTVS
jgi:hypothetical protein